ncbi:MAG: universal stress protein [Halanaeroarchaeum sp.]
MEYMFDDILVPTDGSDTAARALEHAIVLADATGATVHGVYVVDLTYAADFEGGVDTQAVVDALEREGESALTSMEERCETADVPIETALLEGRPASSLVSYVDDAGIDLVTMSTHGRRGIVRLLLGSVTEAVLRSVQVPVLTVPVDANAPGEAYEDVLVATDASADANHAVETAIDLAGAFEGRVHGLYVVDAKATQSQVIEDVLAREGRGAIDDLESLVRRAGLKGTGEVREGVAHEEIVAYADEVDADCIVLGSHGRGAIERTVLGSVSERTIRTADRPVLVTKSPEE